MSIETHGFESLGLHEPILRAVKAEGYETPTPIQLQAIPEVIRGRDLIGCAQTGTGKTAAFALPTLHRMTTVADGAAPPHTEPRPTHRVIRTLILSPTRELAAQIGESFATYGKYTKLRHAVVYGGVSQVPQVRALRSGVDTLIATPGRLIDLMGQRCVQLNHVEILILDEADRMLDMGFIDPLRRIVSQVPKQRQTLMFSATMPDEIRRLAAEWLRDPARIEVRPTAAVADLIQHCVYHIEPKQKPLLLVDYLQNTPSTRTLVFSRTKHGADKIVKHLVREGIPAAAIHGNKSQNNRQRVLQQFKSTRPPVLVATDVASRGLDIDEISHVINYDLPLDAETYVHRIGRTGRAGATGEAISFCGRDERSLLNSIERFIRRSIRVAQPRPELRTAIAATKDVKSTSDAKPGGGQKNAGPKHGAAPAGGGASTAEGPGTAEGSRRKFWRSKPRRHEKGSTAPAGAEGNNGNRPRRPKKHRPKFSKS